MRHDIVTAVDPSAFDIERSRLVAIAARILGSSSDADDIVQEAWLRLSKADRPIDNPPAFLTTVVTRLCLDQLRKNGTRFQAEAQLSTEAHASEFESDVLIADSVEHALGVVIDTLTPPQRAAFVLHDIFAYSFEEVSRIMGRSEAAVRQLASRARHKVQGSPDSTPPKTDVTQSRLIVDAFLAAARSGDVKTLLSLLAPDAVMVADHVGQQMGTEPRYVGADVVATRFTGAKGAVSVTIDGEPGVAWIYGHVVKVAFNFKVLGGLVHEIELIGDPKILANLDIIRQRKVPRRLS